MRVGFAGVEVVAYRDRDCDRQGGPGGMFDTP